MTGIKNIKDYLNSQMHQKLYFQEAWNIQLNKAFGASENLNNP